MSILKGQSLPPWRERLGRLPPATPSGGFWIHAVSVGEARLGLRILAELRRGYPGVPVHITTGTLTGRALAAGGGAPPDSIAALPIDLPGALDRALDLL